MLTTLLVNSRDREDIWEKKPMMWATRKSNIPDGKMHACVQVCMNYACFRILQNSSLLWTLWASNWRVLKAIRKRQKRREDTEQWCHNKEFIFDDNRKILKVFRCNIFFSKNKDFLWLNFREGKTLIRCLLHEPSTWEFNWLTFL